MWPINVGVQKIACLVTVMRNLSFPYWPWPVTTSHLDAAEKGQKVTTKRRVNT